MPSGTATDVVSGLTTVSGVVATTVSSVNRLGASSLMTLM